MIAVVRPFFVVLSAGQFSEREWEGWRSVFCWRNQDEEVTPFLPVLALREFDDGTVHVLVTAWETR